MTENQFYGLCNRHALVLADFYADWCEPCKALDDVLEKLKEKAGSEIYILKIDVDANKELTEKFGVLSVPVLILFLNKSEVWRMNGFLLADELLKIFRKFMKQ